jgi:phospholipase C
VKTLISVLALAIAAAAAPSPVRGAGEGEGRSASPAATTPIRHVVIIVQENRTPDNLFHGLPGADIATQGIDSKGQVITLMPGHLQTNYGLGHSHAQFVDEYDDGKMDGADKVSVNCEVPTNCPPKHPQFMYVYPSDVAPYFQMAETYTFGDRMFQSNQGPSFPAHQFLISGTSTPTAGGAYDNDFVSDNPRQPKSPTGCVNAPPGEHAPIIDPQGKVNFKGVFPCFEHPTVIDLLDQAGHSWSYYGGNLASILVAPNAIQHLSTGPAWNNVKSPPSQVLTDIANGTLSDVSWVTPNSAESDHPGGTDGSGPSWVSSIVNAIGGSPYWQDTAIFIVWDDWGGWYDHVPPPIFSSYEAGFRVPLIVVSPFAKPAYVSHVTHTFGSLVKFIEVTYGLPSLGYQDAVSDDMSDCFNFSQAPTKFQPIKAAYDAAYFLRRVQTGVMRDADDD